MKEVAKTEELSLGWLARLQSKWALNSVAQVLIVLLVFSLTGSTVVLLRKALFGWVGFERNDSLVDKDYHVFGVRDACLPSTAAGLRSPVWSVSILLEQRKEAIAANRVDEEVIVLSVETSFLASER